MRRLQPLRGVAARSEGLASRASPGLARSVATLGAPTPAARLLAMSGRVDPAVRARLVRGELGALQGSTALDHVNGLAAGLHGDALAETLYLDAQLALVDDMLHYFDRASMAHSLEVRVPFLDHDFVEFCATVPSSLKVRGLTTKYLLKEAARDLLPNRVVDKRKVGFFRGAVSSWFSAQAGRAIDDYLLAPDARYTDFLDAGEVKKLVAAHRASGNADLGHLLLALLMLEVWLATYLPRAVAQTPAAIAV
jgi:asparagine synthase (glutamine-hydrolysing)